MPAAQLLPPEGFIPSKPRAPAPALPSVPPAPVPITLRVPPVVVPLVVAPLVVVPLVFVPVFVPPPVAPPPPVVVRHRWSGGRYHHRQYKGCHKNQADASHRHNLLFSQRPHLRDRWFLLRKRRRHLSLGSIHQKDDFF